MAAETKKCSHCSRPSILGNDHCPPRKYGVGMDQKRWDEMISAAMKLPVGKAFFVSAPPKS